MNKTHKPFVLVERARSDEHRKILEEIIKKGKCPFCEKNLSKYHKGEVLIKTKHWIVTTNDQPYIGTEKHLLFISRIHAESILDLPLTAGANLWELFKKFAKQYKIESGALFIRFGDPQFNGGSVRHFHAHMIKPDLNGDWEKIKVKLGSK